MAKIRRGKMISFLDIDVDGVQSGIVQKVNYDQFNDENIYVVRTNAGREFQVREHSIVMIFP